MSKYDADSIRNKLKQQMDRKQRDPDKFVPPKIEHDNESKIFRFFVLPGIMKGDKLKTGTADYSMDMFCITHGEHWVNRKPYACPRVHSDGADKCKMCQFGFDLLKEETDKNKRSAIVREWMPNTSHMVNIYFPNTTQTPEEYRDRVMYFDAPKTCFDIWTQCVMRTEKGDDIDPQAFGVFYDENNAYLFQLEVTKFGQNNSYKTSKFLANVGTIPISKDPAKLQAILDSRIDLRSKIDKPDLTVLDQVFNQITTGDDSSSAGGFDQSEVQTPVEQPATRTESKAPTQVTATQKAASSTLANEVIAEEPDEAVNAVLGGDTDNAPDDEISDLLSQLDRK